jgi:hypothetical protein
MCQVLAAALMLSTLSSLADPDFGQRARLNARGYSISDADMDAAIRKAFEVEDHELLADVLFCLRSNERIDVHMDLVIDLYQQSRDQFRRFIDSEVSFSVAFVDRYAQSRYGYGVYVDAVGVLHDEAKKMYLTGAILNLKHACAHFDIDVEPYLMVALFRGRPNVGAASSVLGYLKNHPASISPVVAYHIYTRCKDMKFFKTYLAEYEAKTKPFLNSPSPPGPESLAAIIAEMEKHITADEAQLREKYGNVAPKPYISPREK